MAQGRAAAMYRVKLMADERSQFQGLIRRGRSAGWKLRRAQALLKCDEGEGEARLVKLARSTPPQGHSRWSLRLLADKLVGLEVVDWIGHECVRQTLEKTR